MTYGTRIIIDDFFSGLNDRHRIAFAMKLWGVSRTRVLLDTLKCCRVLHKRSILDFYCIRQEAGKLLNKKI